VAAALPVPGAAPHLPLWPSLQKPAFLLRIFVRLFRTCGAKFPTAGATMPKSTRNVSEKTKQRKMDVRDRQIKKLNALHPLRCASPRCARPRPAPVCRSDGLPVPLAAHSRKAAKAHKDLLHIDTVDKHLRAVDVKNKPEGRRLCPCGPTLLAGVWRQHASPAAVSRCALASPCARPRSAEASLVPKMCVDGR